MVDGSLRPDAGARRQCGARRRCAERGLARSGGARTTKKEERDIRPGARSRRAPHARSSWTLRRIGEAWTSSYRCQARASGESLARVRHAVRKPVLSDALPADRTRSAAAARAAAAPARSGRCAHRGKRRRRRAIDRSIAADQRKRRRRQSAQHGMSGLRSGATRRGAVAARRPGRRCARRSRRRRVVELASAARARSRHALRQRRRSRGAAATKRRRGSAARTVAAAMGSGRRIGGVDVMRGFPDRGSRALATSRCRLRACGERAQRIVPGGHVIQPRDVACGTLAARSAR